MTDYPIPQKAGLYWAGYANEKPGNFPYYLIVQIIGEAPFLRAKCWNVSYSFSSDEVGFIPTDMMKHVVWGPEIVQPKGDEDV